MSDATKQYLQNLKERVTQMSEAKSAFVIDDDTILDDIDDLPGFITPPNGAYLVSLDTGIEDKEINDSPYYSIALTIKDLLDVKESDLDEGESLPKSGDVATLLFKRDNPFGVDNFKKFVRPIQQKFGARTGRELKEKALGLEMIVVIQRKYNKEKDRHNISVKKAVVQ